MMDGTCEIASGARNWNCVAPGKTSELGPEALGGCMMRVVPCRFRICRRSGLASAQEGLLG
eukprot:7698170-Alexandrium_andersonii.AAC.1